MFENQDHHDRQAEVAQGAPGNTPETNYPKNYWWVAAASQEVTEKPFRRWLLDTPVAMYRVKGEAVALYDRCPHRWAPLSRGRLEGDSLVCPYHGARFNRAGVCDTFPNMSVAPRALNVRSFRLIERGGFIWIWLGEEPVRDSAEPPPAFEWGNEPGTTAFSGYYEFDANYMLLHENVLDLTHFPYLHGETIQIPQWPIPTFHVEGNRVGFSMQFDVPKVDEQMRQAFNLVSPFAKTHEIVAWFETPAWHSVLSTTHFLPNAQTPDYAYNWANHLVTPASMGRTHYWWYFGWRPGLPVIAHEQVRKTIGNAFEEDKWMLSAIQSVIEEDPRGRNYPELSVKADQGGIQARRALQRILASERSGSNDLSKASIESQPTMT